MTPNEFRHLQRGQCRQKPVLEAIPEIHQLNEVTVVGNELSTAPLGKKTVMLTLHKSKQGTPRCLHLLNMQLCNALHLLYLS